MSKLKPGKKYKFELNTGLIQIVDVTSVDADTVVGFIYLKNVKGKREKVSYTSTFETIEQRVVKISVLKFKPFSTVGLSVLATYATTIIIYSIAWVPRLVAGNCM